MGNKSKYFIKNPSQKIIIDSIKNSPSEIIRMNLTFLADGVEIPYKKTNDSGYLERVSKYLKVCEKKNIIPFSNKRIKLGFDIEEKISEFPEGAKRFFGNGRTNQINFDWMMYLMNDEHFERFNEYLFPSLLENNYHVSEGSLTLDEHRIGSHETTSYTPDISININWVGKGLELKISKYSVKQGEKIKLGKWFADLKRKHSV